MPKKTTTKKPLSDRQRAHLLSIAHKGGSATKSRTLEDPDYYTRIGKQGGAATKGIPKKKKIVNARTKPVKPSQEPALETLDAILKELNG